MFPWSRPNHLKATASLSYDDQMLFVRIRPIHLYIPTYIHTYIHTYMDKYLCMHVYIYPPIYIYIYTDIFLIPDVRRQGFRLQAPRARPSQGRSAWASPARCHRGVRSSMQLATWFFFLAGGGGVVVDFPIPPLLAHPGNLRGLALGYSQKPVMPTAEPQRMQLGA